VGVGVTSGGVPLGKGCSNDLVWVKLIFAETSLLIEFFMGLGQLV
jgi:hypothetical protein